MEILLVNTPYFDVWRTFDFLLPPLGLAYIAAVLEANDYDVTIVDLNAGQNERSITDRHWDIVGITTIIFSVFKLMQVQVGLTYLLLNRMVLRSLMKRKLLILAPIPVEL